MDIKVKFVVGIVDYANWIITEQRKRFEAVFKGLIATEAIQSYVSLHFDVVKMIDQQNDFTRELLMSLGDESPLASLELVSSGNLEVPVRAIKPMCLENLAYLDGNHGLGELLDRAIVIASQRKHDVLWTVIWKQDQDTIAFLKEKGFELLENIPCKIDADDHLATIFFRQLN